GKTAAKGVVAHMKEAAVADGLGLPMLAGDGHSQKRSERTLREFGFGIPGQLLVMILGAPTPSGSRQPKRPRPGRTDISSHQDASPAAGEGTFRSAIGDRKAAALRIASKGILIFSQGVAGFGHMKRPPSQWMNIVHD